MCIRDRLSVAAMNVCYNEDELKEFLQMAKEVSKEYPVVVSQFMQDTKEIEFDAVAPVSYTHLDVYKRQVGTKRISGR